MIPPGQNSSGSIVRIHRVYIDQPLEPGEPVSLDGRRVHYLGRVLRVAPGQSVVLFNGDGNDYACEVSRVGKSEIAFEVNTRLPARAESPLCVVVAQAVSRGERMDQTLQKCTELGAVAFQPLWSERVEVRLQGEKLARRQQHWQGVVISACEQSGRALVPEVLPAMPLRDWAAIPTKAARLVLAPGAERTLASADWTARVELLVGPEGGFNESELAMLTSFGTIPVSLGPRVLRTETAGPAALAIAQALGGDLAG